MEEFYYDGLKDCSWIPDTYEEFVEKYSSSTFSVTTEAIAITVEDNTFRYLDTIYVLKEYRNRGIATEIMNHLCKDKRVVLFCNHELAAFYSKFGFTCELPYTVLVKQ